MNEKDSIKSAIIGTNVFARKVKVLIDQLYSQYMLQTQKGCIIENVAYVSEQDSPDLLDGCEIISIDRFIEQYNAGNIEIVIIPEPLYSGSLSFLSYFIMRGVSINSVYMVSTEMIAKEKYSLDEAENVLESYLSFPQLPYLEFHVADHCNLNCKGCEHYSPLVEKEVYTEPDEFEKSVVQLKKYINRIGMIRILGGEPLLNPKLLDFIRITREQFPDSIIYIVTNAILIKRWGSDLLGVMKENDIRFSISYYPPLQPKMGEITQYLEEEGIEYDISPLIKEFRYKQYTEACADKEYSFYTCPQAHCNNLYRGKIAACFMPFTTHYFNEKYNLSIPEDGAIDLYDESLNTEELKLKLLIPFERCSYCGDTVERPWESVKRRDDSPITDWVVK